MMRRPILFAAALAAVIAVSALAPQKEPKLLVLDWASKSKEGTPPIAILIEMGLKDSEPTSWSRRAVVAGAKVAHREGYGFRKDDKLIEPNGWEASSHRSMRPASTRPDFARMERIQTVGVVLHLADVKPDASITIEPGDKGEKAHVLLKDVLAGQSKPFWNGAAVVRLISTTTPVVTAKTEDDFPASCYGPDGTLWLAYISYTIKDESRRVEIQRLAERPANFKDFYTPEYGDQLFVKNLRNGKWSEPLAITGPNEDLVRCAIAVEGNGTAWVVYSAHRQEDFLLFARSIRATADAKAEVGAEQSLPVSTASRTYLKPVACTDQDGMVWLSFQRWEAKGAFNDLFRCKDGKWEDTKQTFGAEGKNSWQPSLAAGPDGGVRLVSDRYVDGDYDILLGNEPIATSSRFEARPSMVYDQRGRLWIAYEEGPETWGKNYGAFDKRGNPLYLRRTVKVVCVQDGKLLQPAAELPPLPEKPEIGTDNISEMELMPRYSAPRLGIDGKGRIWLAYRQKFGARHTTSLGSYWISLARRLDGDHWTDPIEVHHSDGVLDSRPVLLPHASGGLSIFHNSDGRVLNAEAIDNQIYMSYLDLPGEPVEPKLLPRDPGKKDDKLLREAKEENDAVKRCRDHRVEAGGNTYQLVRGEFHRHTEISFDGGPDGSVEDMFRYAIDAANMDWIGNGDHDDGVGREYAWWLVQKLTDAYQVKNRFTPMFTYERSANYPHGHRNCMFARRGIRTLPRLAETDPKKRAGGVHLDDTKMLYGYLKELDGICASHTSATAMGTDWRDNDPLVEPIVEIYQGDRMSYEKEGAPRAGYDPKSDKLPANIAGWFPKGFINLALGNGYRLGFQASSDHFSTHISYCIVMAEKHDRASILAALKKRHCYAATDNILVDVRCGAHVMGDEFEVAAAPRLEITVFGTKAITQIDILKDSDVVDTIKPGKLDYKGAWTDPKPTEGVHYYYIRVLQEDTELAWSSPMWVKFGK